MDNHPNPNLLHNAALARDEGEKKQSSQGDSVATHPEEKSVAVAGDDGDDPASPHLARRRPSRVISGRGGRDPSCITSDAQGPPTVRQRSTLQKLGIAPISFMGGGETSGDGVQYADQAPRSPRSAVHRIGSTLVRRDVSKIAQQRISEMKHKAAAGGGGAVDASKQWHLMGQSALMEALQTNAGGLSPPEVAERHARFGKNELTPPPKMTFFMRLFVNLTSPFSLIMILGSVLTFIITGISSTQKNASGVAELDTQNLALSCVLIGVAFLTSLFQTLQESASDNLMEALHGLTAEFAWVYRRVGDGAAPLKSELVKIPAADIVPGDVVQLNLGEKVPADLRIIECTDLKVNNAALTGENIDVKLSPEAGHDNLFEAKNIARSGCNFTNGNGLGVVFATGDETFFGQIAKSATTAEKPDSLMRREVKRLVVLMAVGGAIFGFTFFAAAFGVGLGWITAVITLVGLFVANIPEGLLPQITIALTITARKMFHHQVIVSNLEIIETLGAVSVICSDKTGTLTLNRMTVAHFVLGGEIVRTAHGPLLPADCAMMNIDDEAVADAVGAIAPLEAIQRVISLNSDACFVGALDGAKPVMDWDVKGDASETALLKFVQQRRMKAAAAAQNGDGVVDYIKAARDTNKRLAYLPFHSKNKYMASVNRISDGSVGGSSSRQAVLVKGAAERVMARCDRFMEKDGTVVPLDDAKKALLAEKVLDLARRAERVFGFAHGELDRPDGYPFEDEEGNLAVPLEKLIFLGMASMIDPPRPTVPSAIKACHKAGIHVIMVTGDHPETAVAISKSLGLITLPLLSEALKLKEEQKKERQQQQQARGSPKTGADNEPFANPSSSAPAPPAAAEDAFPKPAADSNDNAPDRVVTVTTVVEMDSDHDGDDDEIDLSRHSVVVTGDEISRFTQRDWDRVLSCKEHCFARTQPEQKQMIVWRLQERGQIVAMTGDGVNDAPALKAANVGVAVGSGTAVAKEAGQIIIADDDFNSIVVGIREGRIIFENLKKAVTFVTSHALPEVLPYIFAFALDIPLAIETIVILLIDLGTDMLPGIAIAYESVDNRIMSLPPRSASDHLITPKMLIIGYLFAGLQTTFFAYWNFFWVFTGGYGISFSDLRGATQGSYHKKFADLDSDSLRTYYANLCNKTPSYYDARGGASIACARLPGGGEPRMEEFITWFDHVVGEAQAAYFLAVSFMQFANCLNRRQQVMSAFDPKQELNWRMLFSVCFSVAFMCFFIYVPTVNDAFYLRGVKPEHATSACWGIAVSVLIEEVRKFLCRRFPDGIVARLTLF